jgi:hypothetical protein
MGSVDQAGRVRCPAGREENGCGRWVSAVGGALCALGVLAPAAWAQNNTDVTLDFQFPPGFEEENPPANIGETETDFLVNGGSITTASLNFGGREESPVTEAEGGQVSTAAGAFGIGIDATITKDLELLVIPLSYRPIPSVPLGLAVPLVHRSGDHGDVYGIGDISASVGYRWGSPLKVLGITTGFIKAPTGDPAEEDSGEFLPLGTGSWDFALYQTLIKRFGYSRGELTVGFRLNTSADFDADVNDDGTDDDVDLRYGNVINVIVGMDREIRAVPGLIGSLQIDARRIMATHLKIDGQSVDAPGTTTLVDLLPRVKYFVAAGTPLTFGLRIPVTHAGDRDVAFDFGFNYVF